MKLRGIVFSGSTRGAPLIEKYHSRLIGIIGIRVFLGTLNVRLERNVDIRPFSRKSLEHVLPGGKKKNIDGYISEIKIRKIPVAYNIMALRDAEKESIKKLEELKKTAKDRMEMNVSDSKINPGYECWAIQFTGAETNVIEIVAKDILREKLELHDGDSLEIEFFENKR